eukprot:1150640-Pelagomonas_calceolata.AAC.1
MPELKDCRLAPSKCKSGIWGGLCTWMGVSAMRARVWAAGVVEAKVQQINPNFQSRGWFVDLQASCGCPGGQWVIRYGVLVVKWELASRPIRHVRPNWALRNLSVAEISLAIRGSQVLVLPVVALICGRACKQWQIWGLG